ncbi:MAG: phosphoribosyl-ATP diphosphatase [Kiloniellales bacterium]
MGKKEPPTDALGAPPLDARLLEHLYAVVESRRGADPTTSRTARLFKKGTAKIAQKVGEEAVETVIEGVTGNKRALAEESADLLYHLLVLWAAAGVKPKKVWKVLAKRAGGVGEEKSEAAGGT